MGLKLDRANYGRLLLIGASILMWLLMIVLFKTYGYNATWRLWKIDPQKMPFMDFRLIPGSADSFRNGFEPSVENPYDPNGRIFNYPAFWRLFFYTGVTQADTVWISVGMLLLFFISVFVFPENLPIPGAIAMLLVLFSPASILLYERGNVDLIVFVICVMIVMAESRSAYLATLLIMFGTIVKLFPFFGVTVLLKESKKRFLLLFAACFIVLVTYMLATLSSVRASWNLTMRGDGASYGTDVFVTRYGPAISRSLSHWLNPSQLGLLLKYGPMAVALLLLLAVAILAMMRTGEHPEALTERNLAAFRMGASIYVGTFLLGNNWDYRLAFLVLVVPQLVEWIRCSKRGTRLISWLGLILVLLSSWHFRISAVSLVALLRSVEDSRKFWFILDEIFNWLLFASLAYLLIASMTGWVKELPGSILSKTGRR
ncbi:MAG: glycosyltransferase 87 family protein [Bacteroidota bacterium]